MGDTVCTLETRRVLVRGSGHLNGIDEVEVDEDGVTLVVTFFHDAPPGLDVANIAVTGGVIVQGLRVTDVELVDPADPDLPGQARVSLDRGGDTSTYTLAISGLDGMDPRYGAASFTFFPDTPREIDCAAMPAAPQPVPPTPVLDYLAKDYDGFRQLMLDRLALSIPGWQERLLPDIGIMLVEVLAYVADRLSYYQDAVATEAYLGTARRRISVRRHVRLIDYAMHEGCNARAVVNVDAGADVPFDLGTVVFSASSQAGSGSIQPIPFLPVRSGLVPLWSAHQRIALYCWGDQDCTLKQGALQATLVDGSQAGRALHLEAGDMLVFEIFGIAPPDQKVTCHPVRIVSVEQSADPLPDDGPLPLLIVRWGAEDALPCDFPVGSNDAGGPVAVAPLTVAPFTVARGNLVLVEQAMRVTGEALALATGGLARTPAARLAVPGLTFSAPISTDASMAAILRGQDPRRAVPRIDRLVGVYEDDADTGELPVLWQVRPDLIASGPDDPEAAVEIDDDGVATLRFGDGVSGRDPTGQSLTASYRVSLGAAGNVGAECIDRVHDPSEPAVANYVVRNPIAATGGMPGEDVDQVRLIAPGAFRTTLVRAVTASDYAALAVSLNQAVRRANCDLIHSAGRRVARVAISPFGTDVVTPELLRSVRASLEPYRRVGHDVVTVAADTVPLRLSLRVLVADNYLRAHVQLALLEALGSSLNPDGSRGLFHPDNLEFGATIDGSRIIAAAQMLDGVVAVTSLSLSRLFDQERGGYAGGVLKLAWFELPQLDNDPLRPDHGILMLQLEGGRP